MIKVTYYYKRRNAINLKLKLNHFQYLFEIEFCLKLACMPEQRVMHTKQVVSVIFANNIYVILACCNLLIDYHQSFGV